MIFKSKKKQIKTVYKTLYLKDSLIEQINQIAIEHDMSFNGVIVCILQEFLEREYPDNTSN